MRISDWSSDVCSSDLAPRQRPFGETADPDVFYPSPTYQSACAELFAAVKTLAGMIVLTGEPGTGKTTVLRRVTRDVERRSEERRVGKGCVRTCRSRGSPYH